MPNPSIVRSKQFSIAIGAIVLLSTIGVAWSRLSRASNIPADIPRNRIVFADDFNTGISPEWGEESGSDAQITVRDGAARFSVSRTDPKWNGWYRAELKYSEEDFLVGEYGFKFRMYLPPDYFHHRDQEIVTQWHGPTNDVWRGPNLGIFIRNGQLVVQGVWYPDGAEGEPHRHIFWSGDYEPGTWIDWTFHTRFGPDGDGMLKVWKGDEQIVNFRGTNTDDQREWLMLKIGMYPGREMDVNRRTIYFDDVVVWKLE